MQNAESKSRTLSRQIVKMMGPRTPGSPSRSQRVEDALNCQDLSMNRHSKHLRRPFKTWTRPVGAKLLAERCNSLWRLYKDGTDYWIVIGENILEPTEGKRIAWSEGNQVHCRRTINHLHRQSKTYGFAKLFIDYLVKYHRTLWINRIEHTLENFSGFETVSQGGYESQYMIPQELIKI